MDLIQEKRELRKKYRSLRANLENKAVLSSRAVQNVSQFSEWEKSSTVLLYTPVGSEIDTTELLHKALQENKKVLLPVTLDTDGKMSVGLYTGSGSLKVGNFSIPEPEPIPDFDYSTIDLIIMPGVAFDENGGRLGQGKGFYDRFIEKSDALLVGFCYSIQISELPLPMDQHDKRIDYLVSEKGIVTCSG